MTELQAHAIYGVLVRECGAPDGPDKVAAFTRYVSVDSPYSHEWRFQGNLGDGGRFNASNRMGWWVTCYVEDDTPEREEMMDRANAELGRLFDAAMTEEP